MSNVYIFAGCGILSDGMRFTRAAGWISARLPALPRRKARRRYFDYCRRMHFPDQMAYFRLYRFPRCQIIGPYLPCAGREFQRSAT